MLYQRPSFTLPAKSPVTSEKNWDRAFLTEEQFESKYGPNEYWAAIPIDSVPDATGFSE